MEGGVTDQEINKTIHEAMGLPWFTPADKVVYGTPDCPSYTSNWADYGPLLEWAMKQEWWLDFACSLDIMSDEPTELKLLNPLKGSTALAEFIVANPRYFERRQG
jgi:hypothetical protein